MCNVIAELGPTRRGLVARNRRPGHDRPRAKGGTLPWRGTIGCETTALRAPRRRLKRWGRGEGRGSFPSVGRRTGRPRNWRARGRVLRKRPGSLNNLTDKNDLLFSRDSTYRVRGRRRTRCSACITTASPTSISAGSRARPPWRFERHGMRHRPFGVGLKCLRGIRPGGWFNRRPLGFHFTGGEGSRRKRFQPSPDNKKAAPEKPGGPSM